MRSSTAAGPSHTSTAAGSSPTSPGGVQLAGLAHHLIDLRDVLLFEGDLLPGVFFEPHALVHYERQQVVVLAKGCALVTQRFTQDLGAVVCRIIRPAPHPKSSTRSPGPTT